MVISQRTESDQAPTIEKRYYISSLPAIALIVANTIRLHWGIESSPLDFGCSLS